MKHNPFTAEYQNTHKYLDSHTHAHTDVLLAADDASERLRQGMPFHAAVSAASTAYRVSWSDVQSELSQRSIQARRTRANARKAKLAERTLCLDI